MSTLAATFLSLGMLAAFLLAFVGIKQATQKEDRTAKQRGLLMIAMAIIMVANVLIWTV